MSEERTGPVGSRVGDDARRWAAEDPAFRAQRDRLEPFREVSRQVILLRSREGISQEELARRVGTSKSAIVRLESGRHKPSMETLRRVAEAFGGRLAVTIDVPAGPDHPPRSKPAAV
jgi:DNA-binding XRE family transcriptional regulator